MVSAVRMFEREKDAGKTFTHHLLIHSAVAGVIMRLKCTPHVMFQPLSPRTVIYLLHACMCGTTGINAYCTTGTGTVHSAERHDYQDWRASMNIKYGT